MKHLMSTLVDRLKNSEVFAQLQSGRSKGNEELQVVADVLDIFEQFLFVWDAREQLIHVIDINFEGSSSPGTTYQTLLPTSGPLGTVHQLLVSPAGQRLVLVGPTGVTVVELPARWGKHGQFEGGKRRLCCTSRQLAERFFLCSRLVQVSKVRWHPESPSDTHLAVLCSDNYLRVYDVAVDLQTPSHVLALGATNSASLSSCADASFVRSLGEVAVSFAFGHRVTPADAGMTGEPEPLPVYILRGNGDIYTTCINLAAPRERYQVEGPVAMHPAADDNYGTDACDLLCLPSSPAVLVVATPGRLYHCVVIAKAADELDQQDASSEVSGSRYSARFWLEPAAISLYVYESVEPELVLAPGEDPDPTTSPVRLYSDPASDCRYFCSHSAGVHAVALPLVAALQKFAALSDGSDEPLGEHECVVEHLVCTRTVASSPCCPVVGLAVVPHPLLMVVLLATYEVVLLPLVARYRPAPPLEGAATTGSAVGARQEPGEPFEAHVRRLLERSASMPVLRSQPAEPAPLAERLQLLRTAAARLRAEYMQRQKVARHALQLRTKELRLQLEQQQRDTERLQRLQREARQRSERTAARYAEVQQSQQRLVERVEAVYQQCQRGVPTLSDAERSVSRELKQLGDVDLLKEKLDGLTAKFEYQKKQVSLERVNRERRDRELVNLSAAQRETLRAELNAQGDQIAALLATAQAARKALGM